MKQEQNSIPRLHDRRRSILWALATGLFLLCPAYAEEPQSKTEATPATAATAAPLTVDTVPKPEGAEIVLTVSDTRTIMMRGSNDLAKMKSFFETKLAALGWKKDDAKSEVVDGVGFLEFTNEGLQITVTLNPEREGKSMTYIVQGSGVEVPAEKEEE